MTEPHHARSAAEGFGADAERYDRTRPRYPEPLVAELVSALPGRRVLDVGVGTGILARQLTAAGCSVLGVDVDERMVELARGFGVEAEVATFEEWDAAGRSFDAVTAGQTWHWVDPAAGAAKAAAVLEPGGMVALVWNVMQPTADVAAVFAESFGGGAPSGSGGSGLGAYEGILTAAVDGLRGSGRFSEPARATYPWQRRYDRAEWLEQVPTFGGFGSRSAEDQQSLLDAMGDAVDRSGGAFTMDYTAVALTTTRQSG